MGHTQPDTITPEQEAALLEESKPVETGCCQNAPGGLIGQGAMAGGLTPAQFGEIVAAPMNVRFKRVHPDAILPQYETVDASGFDLATTSNQLWVLPGETVTLSTGWKVAVPKGFEMQVRSRSGLARKNGCIVLNAPGTVDADYRGEVGIIFHNTGREPFEVKPGMRLAQGVICPIEKVNITEVDDLDETARGEGGFGHTGV